MNNDEWQTSESPPLPDDYEGVIREKFDWNRVPSWPFIIYALIMLVGIAVPDNDYGWNYSNYYLKGGCLHIIFNWIMLFIPILIIIGFVIRKRLNILIPSIYFLVFAISVLATIIIVEYDVLYHDGVIIKEIYLCLIIFFPPIFVLQSAIVRRFAKLDIFYRIIEGISLIVLILASGYGVYVVDKIFKDRSFHDYDPDYTKTVEFCYGFMACFLMSIITAILGLFNCIIFNTNKRIVTLRILGIVIALGFSIIGLIGSIIAHNSFIQYVYDVFILRWVIIYSSMLFLTAHSGAWLLVRHITIQPKYDIRATSAAEEDGWDDEKP